MDVVALKQHIIFSWSVRSSKTIGAKYVAKHIAVEKRPQLPHDLLQLAGSLFQACDVWPNGTTAYYLGDPPKISPILKRYRYDESEAPTRIWRRLTNDPHAVGIRLARRVWGELERDRIGKWRRSLTDARMQ
jgi:hypothetical protein